jgi:sulfate permease, SulP family
MKFIKEFSSNIKNDTLAGMTVSLAMIPEVVAFAFVAKIDPLVALSGAFMIGIITAVFGGRPGLISGAAGAVAVIFVNMIAQGHEKGKLFDVPVDNMGFFYLFAAVILMGVLQIAAGYFKLGRFVRLIPHPVMLGFVNGLAIVIFMAQLNMFPDTFPSLSSYFNGSASINVEFGAWISAVGSQLTEINEMTKMIGLVAVTMLIIHYLPRLSGKIPAALTAILVVTLFTVFVGLDVTTVGSYIRAGGGEGLKGEFPTFNTELWANLPINFDTLKFIFPYAFLAASVGLIESLMTLNLVDELTDSRGDGNKECIGQGVGNIVSGLFGGTGGCGMIGQTMININAKGRGRLSGVAMALTLLSFILFADKYIEMVPIAALVGVMFMMVIETFAWSSLRIMRKIPASDAFVLVAVSLITVFADLAIAVFAGVIISALVFAWENAKRIRARKYVREDGTKVYEIWGPLFFGAITAFNEKFDVKNDPQNVEIDFIESRISDQSAIEAINILAHKYKEEGKNLVLKHLSIECKELLLKADPLFNEMIEESIDDPRYHVVADPATFD